MARLLRFCAFLFVIFAAAPAFSAGYSCPAYMKYTSCNSGYYDTGNGATTWVSHRDDVLKRCAPQMCEAGITKIHAGSLNIPLYKNKLTTHAIAIGYANKVCYSSLSQGRAPGAFNVSIGGVIYHTVE